MKCLLNILIREDGATIAEYALILGLILIVVATIITTFGTRISCSISQSSTVLPT